MPFISEVAFTLGLAVRLAPRARWNRLCLVPPAGLVGSGFFGALSLGSAADHSLDDRRPDGGDLRQSSDHVSPFPPARLTSKSLKDWTGNDTAEAGRFAESSGRRRVRKVVSGVASGGFTSQQRCNAPP